MSTRIGIIGVGAIGGIVGGMLTKAGHDVTLIDQWPDHVEAMKKAHVEFSHTHGPQGKVDPALRDRRIDELGFYNEGASPGPNSVTPIQVQAQHPVQQNVISAALGSDLSAFVKHWETFQPHPFQDIGGLNIGYGTRPHPGERSISEREAARRMDEELARDRAKIEQLNPQLREGAKKALTSLLYNLGGDVNRLKEHGMAKAIAGGDVEAKKKAHVEFSHTHGPQGKVEPGLRNRRIDELGFYNESDSPAANSESCTAILVTQQSQQINSAHEGQCRP